MLRAPPPRQAEKTVEQLDPAADGPQTVAQVRRRRGRRRRRRAGIVTAVRWWYRHCGGAGGDGAVTRRPDGAAQCVARALGLADAGALLPRCEKGAELLAPKSGRPQPSCSCTPAGTHGPAPASCCAGLTRTSPLSPSLARRREVLAMAAERMPGVPLPDGAPRPRTPLLTFCLRAHLSACLTVFLSVLSDCRSVCPAG